MNWRGHVLIVDDNFIGNKSELKKNLLPAMKAWMEKHEFPFTFNTQASLNLADDDELMALMVETGFSSVFIGIETPEEKSLRECNKLQNTNRDLVQSVKKMQNAGLQVSAGLIVGFDSDTESTFQRQIDFIQESGIVSAMIGLLNAPKKTPLYRRYEAENRIISEASGNNTDLTLNYVPVMDAETLVAGYKRILREIYSPGPFYKRIRQFLRNYNPNPKLPAEIGIVAFVTFVKSFCALGMRGPGWWRYWALLLWTLFNRPHLAVGRRVIFALRPALQEIVQSSVKKGCLMTGFLCALIIEDIGTNNGKTIFRLQKPLVYLDGERTIRVPSGFETDLASVPRLPIVYDLWGNRAHREAVLHDYLYSIGATPESAEKRLRRAVPTGHDFTEHPLVDISADVPGGQDDGMGELQEKTRAPRFFPDRGRNIASQGSKMNRKTPATIDLYHLYRRFSLINLAYPIVLDVLKVWAEALGWHARAAVCREPEVDIAGCADVVGFSVYTQTASATYRLAARLRAAGKIVILGGPHFRGAETFAEAIPFCDVLVSSICEQTVGKLLLAISEGKIGPDRKRPLLVMDRSRNSGTRKNRFSICTARSGSSTPASRYRSAARMPASFAARTWAAKYAAAGHRDDLQGSRPGPAGNPSGCAMRHSD